MSSLTNAIVQGMEARRSQREEDYLNKRRAVVDPRNDAREGLKDEGTNSLIQQYGPQAAVPNERGQLMGEDQRAEQHNLSMRTGTAEADDADHQRAAEATLAFIEGLDAAEAQGGDPRDFAQKNQKMFAQMGLTSDDLIMQHVPGMLEDPAARKAEKQAALAIIGKGKAGSPALQIGADTAGKPAFLATDTSGGKTTLSPVEGGTPSPKAYAAAGSSMQVVPGGFVDKATRTFYPDEELTAAQRADYTARAQNAVVGKGVGANVVEDLAPSNADVRGAETAYSDAVAAEQTFEGDVANASKLISGLSTGYAANIDVKGSPAYQLNQALLSIKANLTLDSLQRLKQASKTGASGLGALSDKEGELLAAIEGSLAAGQDPAQLRRSMAQLITVHRRRLAAMKVATDELKARGAASPAKADTAKAGAPKVVSLADFLKE